MRKSLLPEIRITSRQRSVHHDQSRLVGIVEAAAPMCRKVAETLRGPLLDLDRIEFTVLGNRAMARIHRQFLGVKGATDVITFPYGEILVCASVAGSRAKEFGNDVTTELALYCIHGLLHLAGHDDTNPASAGSMAKEQERILAKAVGKVSVFKSHASGKAGGL